MAPTSAAEDYYLVLEVGRSATLEQVTQSYRRLAKKLHPDRNCRADATEAFQRLGKAYEVLKDQTLRREYDRTYQFTSKSEAPENGFTTGPASQAASASEEAQIAALEKSKRERAARWLLKRHKSESVIAGLRQNIEQVEKHVKDLDTMTATELAQEQWQKSWGAWFLSPVYKVPRESEEVKERKDRARQERLIEKVLKRRKIESLKGDLKIEEEKFRVAKKEVEDADKATTSKISKLQDAINLKEVRKQQEKARAEQEKWEKYWKQQREEKEARARAAAEAVRKRDAEMREAEEKRQRELETRMAKIREEQTKRQQEEASRRAKAREEQSKRHRERDGASDVDNLYYRGDESNCRHGGWWDKVQGRKPCPECSDVWNYLLECPSCMLHACPKCQSTLRPRGRGNTGFQERRRSPSPAYPWGYDF